jgi:hypothetical protein
VRICGAGCDPDDPLDVCDTGQVCLNLGTTPIAAVGAASIPETGADYLITIDMGRYVVGISGCFRLSRWTGQWATLGTFDVGLPGPGAPEQPPARVLETTISWDAFGCTGWTAENGCGSDPTPAGCGCPDFGPGTPFAFTTVASRAWTTLDFAPWGAIEDVASEAVAGVTTRTSRSCPGRGIGTTQCEIEDDSSDAFGLEPTTAPGGTTGMLRVVDRGSGPTPSLTLRWTPSCSYGDADYELYEGSLPDLPAYDHERKLCTTAGETTATFDVGAGNRYFVVVPTDGTIEGSYGAGLSGAERPQAATPCRTQAASPTCR